MEEGNLNEKNLAEEHTTPVQPEETAAAQPEAQPAVPEAPGTEPVQPEDTAAQPMVPPAVPEGQEPWPGQAGEQPPAVGTQQAWGQVPAEMQYPAGMEAAAPGPEAVKTTKSKLWILAVVIPAVILIGVAAFFLTGNLRAYLSADGDLNAGKYEEAAAAFSALGEYRDAGEKYKECFYQKGLALIGEKNFADAEKSLKEVDGYKDTSEQLLLCQFETAKLRISTGNYEGALTILEDIPDYEGAKEQAQLCNYELGKQAFEERDYLAASDRFAAAGDYQDAQEQYKASIYAYAKQMVDGFDYEKGAEYFKKIDGYQDSGDLYDLYSKMSQTRCFDGMFHYHPLEFALLVDNKLGTITGGNSAQYQNANDENALIALYSGGVKSEVVSLMMEGMGADQRSYEEIVVLTQNTKKDQNLFAAACVAVTGLLDSQYDLDDNKAFLSSLLDGLTALTPKVKQTRNGIEYTYLQSQGRMVLSMKVVDTPKQAAASTDEKPVSGQEDVMSSEDAFINAFKSGALETIATFTLSTDSTTLEAAKTGMNDDMICYGVARTSSGKAEPLQTQLGLQVNSEGKVRAVYLLGLSKDEADDFEMLAACVLMTVDPSLKYGSALPAAMNAIDSEEGQKTGNGFTYVYTPSFGETGISMFIVTDE